MSESLPGSLHSRCDREVNTTTVHSDRMSHPPIPFQDDRNMARKRTRPYVDVPAHGSLGATGRTPLPNARQFPRFAGISTYARFPLLSVLDHAPDWAVYGIPFDGGTTYRPGARFGPRAIRDQSAYIKPYHLEHNLPLTERLSIADAGDAPVRPYSAIETIEAASDYALALGDGHTCLLSIGGDHSTCLANLRAVRKRHSPRHPLALIHFDAHLDTVDTVWGEKYGHASPFIRAIEEKLIDPTRMLSVGIRGPLNTAADLDFARENGVEIVTYADVRHRDGLQRIRQFIASLGESPVYLTFDIDVIDPAYAPGTGTPSVGGFSSAQALDLLRECSGVKLVGADLVEVLPAMDPAGITAFLGAHLIFEMLCLGASVGHED